jgi:predicted dehydrogenase
VVFPQVKLAEPLLLECQEFIECMRERRKPLSDAKLGLRVVEALEAAHKLMENQ